MWQECCDVFSGCHTAATHDLSPGPYWDNSTQARPNWTKTITAHQEVSLYFSLSGKRMWRTVKEWSMLRGCTTYNTDETPILMSLHSFPYRILCSIGIDLEWLASPLWHLLASFSSLWDALLSMTSLVLWWSMANSGPYVKQPSAPFSAWGW